MKKKCKGKSKVMNKLAGWPVNIFTEAERVIVEFLVNCGGYATKHEIRHFLGGRYSKGDKYAGNYQCYVIEIVVRLQKKGYIKRIGYGVYAVVNADDVPIRKAG